MRQDLGVMGRKGIVSGFLVRFGSSGKDEGGRMRLDDSRKR